MKIDYPLKDFTISEFIDRYYDQDWEESDDLYYEYEINDYLKKHDNLIK